MTNAPFTAPVGGSGGGGSGGRALVATVGLSFQCGWYTFMGHNFLLIKFSHTHAANCALQLKIDIVGGLTVKKIANRHSVLVGRCS